MVTVNRAVALAMVEGPRAGLALLSTVDVKLPGHYRIAVVRGHLLEMAGDRAAAITELRAAAAGCRSRAEQAFLLSEIARLGATQRKPSVQ
jgi:predicted RNA polymerase sigma factor